MGELIERIKLSNLVNGNGLVDNFKKNSLYFFDKYKQSDKEVTNIPVGKMSVGGFYFLHYRDDSNFMKYSPIFVCDFRKFGNMIVVFGVNFNFIPIEIRASIFDKFISEKDFENDRDIAVKYQGMYDELRKYGFEYAINEYNVSQIVSVHRITMSIVPRFLYSQHPINKYDPKKLYSIMLAKIEGRDARHKEMTNSFIKDFFQASDDILENYDQLNAHIKRLQTSLRKYG